MNLSLVLAFVGIAIAFVSLILFFRFRERERLKTHELVLAAGRETSQLQESLRLSRERADEWQQKAEQSMSEVRALWVEKQTLVATSEAAQKVLENERRSWSEAKEQMTATFQSLAGQTLEHQTRQFLEVAQRMLSSEGENLRTEMELRKRKVDDLFAPLQTTLERLHKESQDLEKDRQKSLTLIDQELRRVVESNLKLREETQALKNALKKPHIRGRWGEVQLKNCIDLAGMSEFADVSFQESSRDDETRLLRPDMVVRMPGGRVVVVDAKTPIDAFLGALEANGEEARGQEMVRHGIHVKEHVRKLSQKAYNEVVKGAADFTVMFLPNESFLYAALETQGDLVEFALDKKILIATPPTFVGLLKVIRYGWNEEKMARNAQQISSASQELHKRLVEFVEAFMGMGKALDKARSEYDVAFKRLNSRVLVQARRLEVLGAKGVKDLPDDLGFETPGLVLEPIDVGDSESVSIESLSSPG